MLLMPLGQWRCLVTLVALLAGYSATPRRASLPNPTGLKQLDDGFPHEAEIMAGMDPSADDAAWRIGDRLLYGIRLENGAEPVTRYALMTLNMSRSASSINLGSGPVASGRPHPVR